ncbi:hypothetical protein AU152_gp66 [Mycobacterium phage Phlei]|uniref:Uncharacterized protein n=1 Tax=Mycobacterium phage Phlei TaxID=1690684 RepID=A0A0N9BDN5_9CAUD|nr:hypothetical protein AU152_gp66 [Mycobacterium phage Phlei]ALA48179.1 hypothetical protein [Mycobacterium phage Phlei]
MNNIDIANIRDIANHIYYEVWEAERPVFAEQIAARPVALETDYAIRAGDALLFIGPDQQYPDGICWAIYTSIKDVELGEFYSLGGWAIDDAETAEREIGEIISTLNELSGEQ